MPQNIPAVLSSAVRRAIARWFSNWRARQHNELLRMSARELNDLGIGRSEIPALLEQPAAWQKDRL